MKLSDEQKKAMKDAGFTDEVIGSFSDDAFTSAEDIRKTLLSAKGKDIGKLESDLKAANDAKAKFDTDLKAANDAKIAAEKDRDSLKTNAEKATGDLKAANEAKANVEKDRDGFKSKYEKLETDSKAERNVILEAHGVKFADIKYAQFLWKEHYDGLSDVDKAKASPKELFEKIKADKGMASHFIAEGTVKVDTGGGGDGTPKPDDDKDKKPVDVMKMSADEYAAYKATKGLRQ